MIYIIGWLIFAMIGGVIGSAKGRGNEGFFLGLFLGPLGILIAACMSKSLAMQVAEEQQKEELRRQSDTDYKR